MANRATKKIDSKTARGKLTPRRKAYYSQIADRLCLGYYRPASGSGRWERRELIDGKYRYRILGNADDENLTANGDDILTYKQARDLAGNDDAPTTGKPLTVAGAIDAYVKNLAGRSSHSQEVRWRMDKHVIPVLGDVRVKKITKTQLDEWLAGMVRGDPDSDEQRKSKDSANRVLGQLRAALNYAFADEANGIKSDKAWRTVKRFQGVDEGRQDHFDATEIKVLIAKAAEIVDQRFADLLEAAFLTGARYGELTHLDVGDFDAKRGMLSIRKGKTGARPVQLSAEAAAFFRRLTKDRPRNAPLLPRYDGGRWNRGEQAKRFKAAAAAAELPATASFYSLRHSHISRAIENGQQLTVIAENCGTSLEMIEKNYAHMLATTKRDVVERTAPKLRRVK